MTGKKTWTRPPLEPPIFTPSITTFRVSKDGPPVCGSCGAGVKVTVAIKFCSAARNERYVREGHDRRVFLCDACVLVAVELLMAEDP